MGDALPRQLSGASVHQGPHGVPPVVDDEREGASAGAVRLTRRVARASIEVRAQRAAQIRRSSQTSSTLEESAIAQLADEASIVESLARARAEGARLQLFVQLPLTVVGFACAILGCALTFTVPRGAEHSVILLSAGIVLLLSAGLPISLGLLYTLTLGYLVICVGALVTALWNASVTFAAYRVDASAAARTCAPTAAFDVPLPCRMLLAIGALQLVLAFLVSFFAMRVSLLLCRRLPPRALLDRLWIDTGRWYMLNAAVRLCMFAILASVAAQRPQLAGARAPAKWLLLGQAIWLGAVGLLSRRPGVRIFVHTWLASRGAAVSTAAGVAAIIGHKDAPAVLSAARRAFRSVAIEDLRRADLHANTPSPETYARSLPAELGQVDAFISHSWSDPADAKWEAMLAWRDRFVTVHGRPPRCWFDRACIDQSSIADALGFLPVHLAGCNSMLVLSGGTYLSRLWCISEIFVFIAMGGSAEQIELVPVGLHAADETHYAAFDVRNAACHVREDYERLLAIVESTHGGPDGFNERVRDVLGAAFAARAIETAASRDDSFRAPSPWLRDAIARRNPTPPMGARRLGGTCGVTKEDNRALESGAVLTRDVQCAHDWPPARPRAVDGGRGDARCAADRRSRSCSGSGVGGSAGVGMGAGGAGACARLGPSTVPSPSPAPVGTPAPMDVRIQRASVLSELPASADDAAPLRDRPPSPFHRAAALDGSFDLSNPLAPLRQAYSWLRHGAGSRAPSAPSLWGAHSTASHLVPTSKSAPTFTRASSFHLRPPAESTAVQVTARVLRHSRSLGPAAIVPFQPQQGGQAGLPGLPPTSAPILC